MLSRLILSAARRSPRLAVQINQARCAHHGHDLEQIPPQFRNITYDDVPLPRGSWQARYDEINAKYNKFLAFSIVVMAVTIYAVTQTHEWIGVPDQPAERWYPLDRFKDGDGKAVV